MQEPFWGSLIFMMAASDGVPEKGNPLWRIISNCSQCQLDFTDGFAVSMKNYICVYE